MPFFKVKTWMTLVLLFMLAGCGVEAGGDGVVDDGGVVDGVVDDDDDGVVDDDDGGVVDDDDDDDDDVDVDVDDGGDAATSNCAFGTSMLGACKI
jgi:hypothetical protein